MADSLASTLSIPAGAERGNSWVSGGFGVVFKVFGSETGGRLAIVEHPIWPRILVMPPLEMISPAGFENFFDQLGQLVATFDRQGDQIPPQERMAEVGELAARFGLRYLPEWIPELEGKYGLQTPGIRLRS